MKIISIHQPDYIPWIGFYYKVAHSDTFIYLDDAQFSNEAAHNFNVIKTPQGDFRLKIPVKQSLGDKINEVKMQDNLKWKEKHLKTIKMNYKKADFFDEVYEGFSEVLLKEYENLAELNIAINRFILNGFQIDVPILKTSDMDIQSVREERILEICTKLQATEYLSGNGARAYQDEKHFEEHGIKLTYLDYKPIKYTQLWNKVGFLPCMSVLDYVFNCGFNFDYIVNQVRKLNAK